ncbi:3-oxoacyl-ACP synthase III family protein [Paeniglutamicibacter sp. ORCA_105]|uniref:3-oxoacyl-ACP synthase III family protein n=1 Tax=Paeniglutamicibacter sp. ORCA_105 TaxID=3377336 RepID=UPI0038963879
MANLEIGVPMKTMGIRVLGSAETMPERIVTTAEVAELCGISTDEAIRRTGVKTRHWLGDHEDPLEQGVLAAEKAIRAAGLQVSDIDLVLNASGTPMQAIPDGGALIAAELGMQDRFAFSVHATCISFLVAFKQAAFYIDAGLAEFILIVSTEAGSRGLNFAQPESAILIGDAAVAVVVGKPANQRQGIVAAGFSTDTAGIRHAEIRGFGSRLRVEEAVQRTDDFKFDMQGLSLLRGALKRFTPFLETVRPGLSTNFGEIDRIIPHQTSRAGMQMMSKYWGWEKMVVTLGEVGNTIAASIPLAMHRAEVQPGETALMIGTGAGTHYGALIVQW